MVLRRLADAGGAGGEETISDLNVGSLLDLGESPQLDIDTMFLLFSGFIVRFLVLIHACAVLCGGVFC